MKNLQRVRTRRQLLRVTAVGAASFPFLALARKSASAQRITATITTPAPTVTTTITTTPPTVSTTITTNNHSCFLKDTKLSTPSGDRLVQELRIGDEVQTLAGRKTIKWIGYNKFTKEEGRAWQHSVMPIRVTRSAIGDHIPAKRVIQTLGNEGEDGRRGEGKGYQHLNGSPSNLTPLRHIPEWF